MDTQAMLLIGLLIAVIVAGPFLLNVLFNKTGDAVVNKYRESANKSINEANAAAGPRRLADRYPGFVESLGSGGAVSAQAAASAARARAQARPAAAPVKTIPAAEQPTQPLYRQPASQPARPAQPVQQAHPARPAKPAQQVAPARPAVRETPAQVFCMFCGKKIDTNAMFCPYCGKKQA